MQYNKIKTCICKEKTPKVLITDLLGDIHVYNQLAISNAITHTSFERKMKENKGVF